MRVSELIKILETLPQDHLVFTSGIGGHYALIKDVIQLPDEPNGILLSQFEFRVSRFTDEFKKATSFLALNSLILQDHGYQHNDLDTLTDILNTTEELKAKLAELLQKANTLDSIARTILLKQIANLPALQGSDMPESYTKDEKAAIAETGWIELDRQERGIRR